jgi:excisionase family DNA binding protein
MAFEGHLFVPESGEQVLNYAATIDIGAVEPPIDDNDVLTSIEAAKLLKVHPVTLRKKAAAWGLPHRRLGTDFRFSRKRLVEWLQSN